MRWLSAFLLIGVALTSRPAPAEAPTYEMWTPDKATAALIESKVVMPPDSCPITDYTRYYVGWILSDKDPGPDHGKFVYAGYFLGGDKGTHVGEQPPEWPTDQGCRRVIVRYDLAKGSVTAKCDFSFSRTRCADIRPYMENWWKK